MITEDYVSFETAKLLKEKGFDEPCALTEFDCDAYKKWVETAPRPITLDAESEKPFRYSVPSIYVAMKWIRKKHNLYIDPYPEDNNTWCLIIWELYPKCVKQCKGKYDDLSYLTPEEACEAAIRYCLEKLI